MAADQAAVDAMRANFTACRARTHRHRRGRCGRRADALHRRGNRRRRRSRRSISASRRSKARRSAPRTCRARSPSSPWRRPARCCMRPTSTWTRSPSVRAIPKASSISIVIRPTTSERWRSPRASRARNHGQHSRSAAPRRTHPQMPQRRRLRAAHQRRRRRGDHLSPLILPKPASTCILAAAARSEGVLAACVLRCVGGQMQGRLALETRRSDRPGRSVSA